MATYTPTTPSTRSGVNAPSRRELLGAAGFTALTGLAAVTIAVPDTQAVEVLPTPRRDDAGMLALSNRFLHLEAQIVASYDREAALFNAAAADGATSKQLVALEQRGEVERNPWTDEQREVLTDLSDMSASTLEGQRARARVLIAWYSLREKSAHYVGMDGKDILPLFRDLLGGCGLMPHPTIDRPTAAAMAAEVGRVDRGSEALCALFPLGTRMSEEAHEQEKRLSDIKIDRTDAIIASSVDSFADALAVLLTLEGELYGAMDNLDGAIFLLAPLH